MKRRSACTCSSFTV